MRRLVFAAFMLVGTGGCELVFDTHTLQSTADGATDASTEAAANNLLANGDFEEGVAACGPGWTTTNGTMTRNASSHSGGHSCELCGLSAGNSATLMVSPSPAPNITTGATYYAQAWVKIEDTSTVDGVALDLEELRPGGFTLAYQKANAATSNWQLLQANTAPALDGGTGLNFMVHAGNDGGVAGCVLIDDAQLIAQ